jgi:hypothetical protein
MAQTIAPARPQLVAPRRAQTLDAVRSITGGNFDVDAWHVMERRDEALIEEEILHGHLSAAFVYRFPIAGKEVSGVSVIGARHLASHYGGIKHRLVSAARKRSELFIFTTFPMPGIPMQVTTAILPELADEVDFYTCVAEIEDIKTGNSIQVERTENRWETSSNGRQYERPNYATIAQSKCFRNGVLGLLPQDVIIRWKAEVMKLGKDVMITESVLDEKRSGVLRFATRQGLIVDRRAVEELTLDQIAGLGDAARSEQIGAFVNAARGLGLEIAQGEPEQEAEVAPAPPKAGPTQPAAPAQSRRQAAPRSAEPPPSGDDDMPAHLRDVPPVGEAQPPAGTAPQQPTAGAPRGQVNFEI